MSVKYAISNNIIAMDYYSIKGTTWVFASATSPRNSVQIWTLNHLNLDEGVLPNPIHLATVHILHRATTIMCIPQEGSTQCVIATGHTNGDICLWRALLSVDEPKIELLRTITNEYSPVTSIDIDQQNILVSFENGQVGILDTHKAKFKQLAILCYHTIHAARFRDSQSIFVASHSNEIKLWDLREKLSDTSSPVKTFLEHPGRSDVYRTVWSIDFYDRYLISSTAPGYLTQNPPSIMIHDETITEPYPIINEQKIHETDIRKVQFQSRMKVILSCSDETVALSNLSYYKSNEDTELKGILHSDPLYTSQLPLHTFIFDSLNDIIVASSDDEMVYITKPYMENTMYF